MTPKFLVQNNPWGAPELPWKFGSNHPTHSRIIRLHTHKAHYMYRLAFGHMLASQCWLLWQMRRHLISLDAQNETNLLEIQTSICILVLDDRRPMTLSEVFFVFYCIYIFLVSISLYFFISFSYSFRYSYLKLKTPSFICSLRWINYSFSAVVTHILNLERNQSSVAVFVPSFN